MDVDTVVIEELDESQVPECELTEFEETEPIQYERFAREVQLNEEEEEILLKKFVNGEVEFPDYYTRQVPDDEDYYDLGNSMDEAGPSRSTTAFKVELLTAARESLKGNFQGTVPGRQRRKNALNTVLQGLMGQANLCYARGQVDIAEKLCMEIIRQNPLVAEPFMTLAQIYETKDPIKSLQFATVSAHLSTNDREQWIRLAEVHIERKNFDQARNCFSNALRYCPKDYDLRLRKAHLLTMMNEEKLAMLCYYKALEVIPAEKGELCLEIARKVSKHFHKAKRHRDAMIAMQHAYKLAPHLFSTEDQNLYLELLMMNEEYRLALKVLTDNTGVEIAVENDKGEILIVACVIPDNMLPEFRIKLAIVLLHLKAYHLLDYVLNNVLTNIPPQFSIDLYVDLTEELIKEQRFAEVITFLTPVVASTKFVPPPYVWLCFADCHRALNKIDEAIKAYYTVVQSAPNCFDARLTLSALLKQQGHYREAIKVLEQDANCDPIDPRLLYERCLMLKGIGDLEQYLNVGYLVLLRTSIRFLSRDELYSAATTGNRCRKEFIKGIMISRKEIDGDVRDGPEFIASDGNLTVDDEYELYKDLVQTAYELRKFGIMEKLAFTALISPIFRSKYSEMETTILFSSLYNDDPQVAFEYFRSQIVRNLNSNDYWNLYSLILQRGDDVRYRRFAQRLQLQVGNPLLRIPAANYYLFTGSYKYALNEYMSITRKVTDPLILLAISVIFNQLSGQKNTSNRATAQMHATAFMKKYAEERLGPDTEQEVYYNMGRLYQSAGMMHIAIDYYEKALAVNVTDMIREHEDVLSLKREIAFNLHLIYKATGNMLMARKVIRDHVVI